MSLSHSPAPQEHTKFPHISVSAIPSVPTPDKKPSPAPRPAPAPSAGATPAPAAAPAPAAPKPKFKWLDVLLDSTLVLMVAGVLGGGGYFLKTQWDMYRIPSIMEIAYEECEQLCNQRDALQDAYNHADEQLLMRDKLAALDARLKQRSQEEAQLNASIDEHRSQILALQHAIRRADREARNSAKGILPGLPLGDVSTKSGKVYADATISRMNGKMISLRTPYGAASVPVNDLVKEKLPQIVLYALGFIDLVDMSDFTANGDVPTSQPRINNKLRKPEISAPAQRRASLNYEPSPSGPVVDTKSAPPAQGSPISAPPSLPRASGDIWNAPSGDLPL